MSPRSFTVRLLVGRTLEKRIACDTANDAEVIACYLFREQSSRPFDSSAEEIVDIEAVEPEGVQ